MAELISARIRDGIVGGSLRPGDRLPSEDSLMGTFGVSRPTLREAIRLDVRRGAQGGPVVRRPSALPALRSAAAWLALGDQDADSLSASAWAGGDDSDLVDIVQNALRTALAQVQARTAA
jgi:DNA-binding FadR family transcriptional regulator